MRSKINEDLLKRLSKQVGPNKDYEIRDASLTGFVLIVRRSGSLVFCVRYRNAAGTAKKFTIGAWGERRTVAMARKEAKRLLGAVDTGEDIQAEKIECRARSKVQRQSTLGYFLTNHYEDWIVGERKSGKAIVARIRANFSQWTELPLSEISSWSVTKWRSRRLKSGTKPSTLNRDIGALKGLLNKAVEWDVLEKSPLATLKPLKVSDERVRFLTQDEEFRLRHALDERQSKQRKERASANRWRAKRSEALFPDLSDCAYTDYLKPIVVLALNTGMRKGELYSLRVSDVDVEQSEIYVAAAHSKSGAYRHIPLNGEAKELLQLWISQESLLPTDLVFSSPINKGKMFDNTRKAWKSLMSAAEITDFRFHDLRHTFASNLVMSNVDLYTVKNLMGHSSIESTQRYAHLSKGHMISAVERLVR